MSPLLGLALFLAAAGALWLVLHRRRAERRREERELASMLVPEIRAILEDSETRGAARTRYEESRGRLPAVLPRDTVYAVETFYRCAEALVEAKRAMSEAFAEDGEVSLGDRIRAKDYRDRCMKDVYYAGEAAIQKLESAF